MALVLADRVLETSTSEGLSTFALAGAQTGYQTFSDGIGNGNTCYYTINGQTTEQWEVGIGTVSAGTLARTTLISSNTGSFINFVAGVKNVFVTQPASKSIYKDASGNAIPLGSASATQLDITAQGDLRLQDSTGGEYVALQAPATIATSYTLTLPVDDGTAGQALITDGSGVLSWSTAASGDVYGPASATDNAVARYDGTTGKIIQNSAVTIADNGATVIAANSASDGLRITQIGAGNALLVEDSANPDATPFVVDASGNVGIGTTTPTSKLHVSGSTKTGGILVEDSNSLLAAPAIEVIGKRSDANAFPAFAGKLLLARQNTVAAISSNMTLGAVAFGGNHTDGTLANILYPASIVGISTGAFSSATAMPTSLLFQTGSTGVASDTTGVTIGTERMRVSDTGVISLGAAPGSESLRVTPVASAVNYLNVQGAVTTGAPVISAAGSDTNIGLALTPKGTGGVVFPAGAVGTPSITTTSDTNTGIFFPAADTLAASTAGTERIRITSTGKFGFNTSAPGTNTYLFAGQITGGTNSGSVVATPTIQSDVTVNANIFRSDTTTQAAAFTLSTLRHFSAVQGTLGAGSAITDQFGFIAESSLTGATNNYGFYSDIAAGTNRYNFYANGTADNLFQGKVGIGTAPYSNLQLLINGTVISTTTSAYAVLNTAASDTNTSVAFTGFFTQLSTSTTALTQLNYYYANQGTFSGTVATQRGFYVSNTLTGATTNIGFNSDIAEGANRFNFYAGGTAQNVFVGQTIIGGFIGSEALRATPVASAVNYVEVTGAITTASPALSAAGSDTNIDLTLTPKGTGVLKFGTYTAGIIAQAGYISIKDAGGTTRRLLVG